MTRWRFVRPAMFLLVSCTLAASSLPAADDAGDELIDTIINLLGDKDPDLRNLGLEQVREQAKGPAATRRFAAILPKLSPDAQVGLLIALADRGDAAAKPTVIELIKGNQPQVRAAALRASGVLGGAGDVPLLAKALTSAEPENTAAAAGLARLSGPMVNAAIVAQLGSADPKLRAELLKVLAARRATDSVPAILAETGNADAGVREAALDAFGQLARTEDVAALVPLVLKSPDVRQTKAAERAITLICYRITDPKKRAEPLLAAYAKLNRDEKRAFLPTLGRLGSPAVLKITEAAIADPNPLEHAAGIRALCNWPDGSVGARLLELAKNAEKPGDRAAALSALIRVAPLPDERTPGERLKMLKAAMELAKQDEQRKVVLDRAKAVRTVETLRYVASYLNDPNLVQQACATIVELAHYRDLREPNKADFDRLLDHVIATSKDDVIVFRAKRYKAGQTYNRKEKPEASGKTAP